MWASENRWVLVHEHPQALQLVKSIHRLALGACADAMQLIISVLGILKHKLEAHVRVPGRMIDAICSDVDTALDDVLKLNKFHLALPRNLRKLCGASGSNHSLCNGCPLCHSLRKCVYPVSNVIENCKYERAKVDIVRNYKRRAEQLQCA